MDSERLEDEFIKADEGARFLRLSRGAFYNLVNEGRIPHYRLLGRRSLRFKKTDLEKLLKPSPR